MRFCIFTALVAVVCAGPVEAQTAPTNNTDVQFLKPMEIIRRLPGRWEYRPEDGWKSGMLARSITCAETAERIWFEREDEDFVFNSQHEASGSKPTTSRVKTDGDLIFQKPLIRVQYEGEKGWDKDGKPIIWELWMPNADTFYWRILGWPRDVTMPPVRRCKDKGTS